MELHLAHNGLLDLAVEVQLDDVRVGGVDQGLDLLGVDGERDLLAAAIDYTRDQTLATKGLGSLLAELGTLNCFYFKSFHFE